jgi:hypothetical protein
MSKYEELKKKPKQFNRLVGINYGAFQILLEKIKKIIEEQKQTNPKSKRGKKSDFIIEDQLLLTLYYLRNYHTFLQLGSEFKISEGYANKVFHKISKILIRILQLPSNKELTKEGLKAIVIDASEQPIEKPVKKQKEYYSGKKTPYHKGTISNMFSNIDDIKSKLR